MEGCHSQVTCCLRNRASWSTTWTILMPTFTLVLQEAFLPASAAFWSIFCTISTNILLGPQSTSAMDLLWIASRRNRRRYDGVSGVNKLRARENRAIPIFGSCRGFMHRSRGARLITRSVAGRWWSMSQRRQRRNERRRRHWSSETI